MGGPLSHKSRKKSFSLPANQTQIISGDFSEATDGTMCPGVDSASRNEYQKNSWGSRWPVCKGYDLTTFIVLKVEKIQEP
jgi:hypothetical protein